MEMVLKTGHLPGEKMERIEIYNDSMKDAVFAFTAEHFNMSLPAVSKHLAVLKEADLIRDQREGKYIFYELNASVLDEALLWLKDLRGD
jgi:DNA-binding transcriptional ArsR family regulator